MPRRRGAWWKRLVDDAPSAVTVTVNKGASQDDPTTDAEIVFDVVFSEAVTGFTDADVTLSGTAGADTAVVAGSGSTYTVTVSGMTATGTVIASVDAGAATSAATSVANDASTSTDNSVDWELVPAVVEFKAAGTHTVVASGNSITVPLPAGFAAGDFCLVQVTTGDFTTADFGGAPLGWTKAAEGEGVSARNNVATYYRRLQAGDGNPTIGFGATVLLLGRSYTFTNVHATTPMDVGASGQQSASDSFAITGLTPTATTSMQVVCAACNATQTVVNAQGHDVRGNDTSTIQWRTFTKQAVAAGVQMAAPTVSHAGGSHAATVVMLRAA